MNSSLHETTATIASVRIVFRFKYIKFNPNLRWFSPDTSKALSGLYKNKLIIFRPVLLCSSQISFGGVEFSLLSQPYRE